MLVLPIVTALLLLLPYSATAVWLTPGGICTQVSLPFHGCTRMGLMPPGLTSLAALSCELLICPFSDHSAVVTTHSIPSRIPQVPGRWQLNVSLLHDNVFVSAVEIVWTSWKAQRGFLPPGLMGLGKGTYKGHCN